MKKFVSILFAALTLLAMPIGAAALDTVYVSSGYGPYQTGSGGEFSLSPNATSSLSGVTGLYNAKAKNFWEGGALPATGSFQTFCLEVGEYLYAATTHSYIINKNAVSGKGGAGPNGDPISKGTAFLYSQFAKGTLAGYNYGAGRLASADALQKAFWYLEQESAGSLNAAYTTMLVAEFGSVAAAMADNNGLYNVAALNLYAVGHSGDPAYLRQDVLVLTPEPMTMILFGLGLIGLAGLRRRS